MKLKQQEKTKKAICGLTQGNWQQEIRTMRTYWRQRNDLVQSASRHIQRIQKAMTQMNIELANVLSDVSGMTGQAIVVSCRPILDSLQGRCMLAQFRGFS